LRKRKVAAVMAEAEVVEDTSPRSIPLRREAVLFHRSVLCRRKISAAAE
jgi:hypothetical protein